MTEVPKLMVVDASVILKWHLNDEECISQAIKLRDDYYLYQAYKVIAPHLFIYEVVNAMAVATRRERITPDNAIQAIANVMNLGIVTEEVEPLRVFELAIKYHLAAYDTAYLAVAESKDCDLWTGDRTFYQAVKNELRRVRWIGDYTSSYQGKI
jgi:predicted nucleic acid-binding protein